MVMMNRHNGGESFTFGHRYLLGFAWPTKGLAWKRRADAGSIEASQRPWESSCFGLFHKQTHQHSWQFALRRPHRGPSVSFGRGPPRVPAGVAR